MTRGLCVRFQMATYLRIRLFYWLILTLVVYALPFFGALAGMAAFHSGAGIIAAFLVAIIVGAWTPVIGQFAFVIARSAILRAVVAATFAIPTAFAGYHINMEYRRSVCLVWRDVFTWIGAAGSGWPPSQIPAAGRGFVERTSAGSRYHDAARLSLNLIGQGYLQSRRWLWSRQSTGSGASFDTPDTWPSIVAGTNNAGPGVSSRGCLRQSIPPFPSLWFPSLRLNAPTSCTRRPTSATTSLKDAVQRTDAPGLVMA